MDRIKKLLSIRCPTTILIVGWASLPVQALYAWPPMNRGLERNMNLFGWTYGGAARKAADEILNRIAKKKPELQPIVHDRPHGVAIELPGFWVITLDNVQGGVSGQVFRPGLPGFDDPAFIVKIYHYESTADLLVRYSTRDFTLYDLRVDAVYEVLKNFADHYGTPFTAGTRLTFTVRNFLPYEDGHTVSFRECTIYIQSDDELYARFSEYIGLAPADAQIVPGRSVPL